MMVVFISCGTESGNTNTDSIDQTIITADTDAKADADAKAKADACLLYTSPSPRDRQKSRMPSSA